ncbi:uncharacterized protein BDW70DRAFT_26120 [Aspergillus foveolatus]|uniref:uncharacterized protein n=1 Tax=Aspergillus foveolatus TaxID=210207 RepID=UPI003CCD00F8
MLANGDPLLTASASPSLAQLPLWFLLFCRRHIASKTPGFGQRSSRQIRFFIVGMLMLRQAHELILTPQFHS